SRPDMCLQRFQYGPNQLSAGSLRQINRHHDVSPHLGESRHVTAAVATSRLLRLAPSLIGRSVEWVGFGNTRRSLQWLAIRGKQACKLSSASAHRCRREAASLRPLALSLDEKSPNVEIGWGKSASARLAVGLTVQTLSCKPHCRASGQAARRLPRG